MKFMQTHIKRWLLTLLIGVLLLAGASYLWLPAFIQSKAAQVVEQQLGRKFTLGQLDINPLTLQVNAGQITLFEANGQTPFVYIKQLDAKLSWASVWRLAPVVNQLAINGVDVAVVRLSKETFNFSDILRKLAEKPPSDPARFALYNLTVKQGTVRVDDQVSKLKHNVESLDLSVPFISSLPHDVEIYIQPQLSMVINGEGFNLVGKSKPFAHSLDSDLALKWEGIKIANWLAYSPVDLPVAVQDGLLNTDLQLNFKQQGANTQLSIKGNVQLKQLKLADKQVKVKAPAFFSIDTVKLVGVNIEPFSAKLNLDQLIVEAPKISAIRDAQGVIDVQKLLQTSTPKATPQAAQKDKVPAAKPWAFALNELSISNGQLNWLDQQFQPQLSIRANALNIVAKDLQWPLEKGKVLTTQLTTTIDMGDLQGNGARTQQSPLTLSASLNDNQTLSAQVKLQKFGLQHLNPLLKQLNLPYDIAGIAQLDSSFNYLPTGALTLQKAQLDIDRLNLAVENSAQPLRVNKAVLLINDSSLLPETQLKTQLHLTMPKQSFVKVAGTVHLPTTNKALTAALKVDAAAVDALPILAFVPALLAPYNLQAASAIVSAKGDIKLSGTAVQWTGDVGVDQLHVLDGQTQDLLKIGKLTANGMQLDTAVQPNIIHLGRVTIEKAYAKVLLDAQGRFNLTNLVKQAPALAESKPVTSTDPVSTVKVPSPQLSLLGLDLVDTDVDFTDQFIKPNYKANITQLTGRIGEVSSHNPKPADLSLKGAVQGDGDLTISGKVNPLGETLYLDLTANAKGIELTQLSPYSAKYADYNIVKGKLSAQVSYMIDQGKLKASNNVKIDQLTFGDTKIGSTDATKLPVKLAVALLKDRNGVIDIDLPVTGSLNDPQFSVAKLVWQVLGNLIVKAVTSPFALLGSLFGGGESLSYIDFAPGSQNLDAVAKKKLDTIAKAMSERPAIRLDIMGRSSQSTDEQGLRQAWYTEQLRTEKVKDKLKKNRSIDVAQIQNEPNDEVQYLEAAYKAATFSKPKNFIGMTKSISVDEMRKSMLANAAVTPDDVKQLAAKRAQAVQTYLLTAVDKSRMFVVSESEDKAPKDAKPSRVDFVLK